MKLKILSLHLFGISFFKSSFPFAVFLMLTFIPAFAQFSGEGAGMENDPYLITSVDELQEMNDDLSAHYELANDIDASATADWNDGEGFLKIGPTNINPFLGAFDGNNYQISGLFINLQQVNIGMFGSVGDGAIIKNAHLVDVDITGKTNVGGLVGFNFGTVTNSFVSGIVKGYWNAGCILGANAEHEGASGLMELSYSTCTLEGIPDNGSPSARIGGLVGWNPGGKIVKSYSMANISGGNDVGGIVGNFSGYIEEDEYGYVGNTYFAGTISGDSNTGGLFGTYYAGGGDVSAISSYWDTETTEMTIGVATTEEGESLNIIGLTTSEMQTQSSFEGWDFEDTWSIEEGEGYPYLQSNPENIAASNEKTYYPEKFALLQNYPNPFNPMTNISYSLPKAAQVHLQVFDMLGRNVATLVNERKAAGRYTVRFEAGNLSSGMYIYRIDAGNFVQTRKLMLIK
ncbi:MAG: T9SS type A sorting domain-containing protein [Balneolaceae bacterium]